MNILEGQRESQEDNIYYSEISSQPSFVKRMQI